MAYTNASNKANQKYVREHQKQISIKYKKEDYENMIAPAIDKSGLPMATFIKQAIAEKIKRDGLSKEGYHL